MCYKTEAVLSSSKAIKLNQRKSLFKYNIVRRVKYHNSNSESQFFSHPKPTKDSIVLMFEFQISTTIQPKQNWQG